MTRNRPTQTHRYHTLPPGISFNRRPPRYVVYIRRSETGDGRQYHVCSAKTLDAAREVRTRVMRDVQAYRDPARNGSLFFPTITEADGRYEHGEHVYESPFAAIAASGRDYYKRTLAQGEAGIADEDVVWPDSRLVGDSEAPGTDLLPVDTDTADTAGDVAVPGEGLWELTDRLEAIIAAIRTQLDTTPPPAGLDAVSGDGPVWETGHTVYEIERLGSDTHVITRDTGTVEARDGLIFYDATATSPCTPESARRLAAGLIAAAAYIEQEQGRE